MTKTQRAALAQINAAADATLGTSGISISTLRALARLGEIELTELEPVRMYGTLGPAGGRNRGYWSRRYIVRHKNNTRALASGK